MQHMTVAEMDRQFSEVFGSVRSMGSLIGQAEDSMTVQARLSADGHRVELTITKRSDNALAMITRTSDSVAEALVAIFRGIPGYAADVGGHDPKFYKDMQSCVGRAICKYIQQSDGK